MRMFGHGADVSVRAALPPDTDRQSVRDETLRSGRFGFHIDREGSNRVGVWERTRAEGPHALTYSATVRTTARRFDLAPRIRTVDVHPPEVQPYLRSDARVQSDAPEVLALLERLVPPDERDNVSAIVRAATRRGCVCPITPATPRPASRHNFGSWVLLPEPVSSATITTWLSRIVASSSSCRSLIGSESGYDRRDDSIIARCALRRSSPDISRPASQSSCSLPPRIRSSRRFAGVFPPLDCGLR